MMELMLYVFSLILYACAEPKPKLVVAFLMDVDRYRVVSVLPQTILKSIAHAQQLLPTFNLSDWQVIRTKCLPVEGLHETKNRWKSLNKKIHVFIGPSCCGACHGVALFAGAYKIPQVTYGCSDTMFLDKKLYPTYTSVAFELKSHIPKILRNFIDQTNIDKLGILTYEVYDQDEYFAKKFALKIEDYILYQKHYEHKVTVAISGTEDYMNFDEKLDAKRAKLITDMLDWSSSNIKVIFIAGETAVTKYILRVAYSLGIMDDGVLFIVYRYCQTKSLCYPHVSRYEDLIMAQKGVLTINDFGPQYRSCRKFLQSMIHENADDERFQSLKEIQEKEDKSTSIENVTPAACALYDAVQLWAIAVGKAVENKLSPNDGVFIANQIRKMQHTGITGEIKFTENGSRIQDFVLSVVQNNGTFVRIGDYSVNEELLTLDFKIMVKISWAGDSTEVPGSVDVDSAKRNFSKLVILSYLGLALFLTLCVIVLSRRIKFWIQLKSVKSIYIRRADIKLYHNTGRRVHSTSAMETQTLSQSQFTFSNYNAETDTTRSFESFIINDFTDIGYYKNAKIVVKFMRQQTVNLKDEKLIMEFLQIQKLRHFNLNPFIGVCVEEPDICICMAYCSRGSLWDIIANRPVRMTWDFRMAIALDIARGMMYLHSSGIHSHGHLTSTNCVVDRRWTCKITDYGLSRLRRGYLHTFSAISDEDSQNYLWTAPELLRISISERPLCGTKQGDVYSFGIIVQELCYQDKPFGVFFYSMGPTYIISAVKAKVNPPFRPMEMSDKSEMPGDYVSFTPKWLTLMEHCWHENPSKRLRFQDVIRHIEDIHNRKPLSAIDNMLAMLASYTARLENIISERSQLLIGEKARADTLLYSILPKSVAEQLKQGNSVLPEYFEAVTVFISDLVQFTQLAAASTPIQVVNFLGVLYSTFDEIIDRSDVYKVETIGDAYVVASGLPVRNADDHVFQAAHFAIDILSAVLNFNIPHMPDANLKIRIGLHTGPVVAGVVGIKMPRYAMFGTAVSTAYYMEETCPANAIHVSDTTGHLLMKRKRFILSEYQTMDYEDKKDVMTYRLRGRSMKRSMEPEDDISDPTRTPSLRLLCAH